MLPEFGECRVLIVDDNSSAQAPEVADGLLCGL
jgi:hypothetical protein